MLFTSFKLAKKKSKKTQPKNSPGKSWQGQKSYCIPLYLIMMMVISVSVSMKDHCNY